VARATSQPTRDDRLEALPPPLVVQLGEFRDPVEAAGPRAAGEQGGELTRGEAAEQLARQPAVPLPGLADDVVEVLGENPLR
jgi:hypothetical protein